MTEINDYLPIMHSSTTMLLHWFICLSTYLLAASFVYFILMRIITSCVELCQYIYLYNIYILLFADCSLDIQYYQNTEYFVCSSSDQ